MLQDQSCHSKEKVILGLKSLQILFHSIKKKKKMYLKPGGRIQFKRVFTLCNEPNKALCMLYGAILPLKSSIISFFT